jgi:hypothetical protein
MYPIFNSAIGGFKLQVDRDDLLKANFFSDQFYNIENDQEAM